MISDFWSLTVPLSSKCGSLPPIGPSAALAIIDWKNWRIAGSTVEVSMPANGSAADGLQDIDRSTWRFCVPYKTHCKIRSPFLEKTEVSLQRVEIQVVGHKEFRQRCVFLAFLRISICDTYSNPFGGTDAMTYPSSSWAGASAPAPSRRSGRWMKLKSESWSLIFDIWSLFFDLYRVDLWSGRDWS